MIRWGPCLLLAALLGVAGAGAAAADGPGTEGPGVEMLSKADAFKIFSMSREQWERNINTLVASGVAERTYPSVAGLVGVLMNAPEGIVITRLDYSGGDARPGFVQMAFTVPPAWVPLFSEDVAQRTVADIKRQLAPEFEVQGGVTRLRGGPAFLFIIRERAGARKQEAVEQTQRSTP
jgi:hypothetical protein